MTLFFVTDRADAHVARFDALFGSFPGDYELVRVSFGDSGDPLATIAGASHVSWASIRQALGASGSLVISGPLDTVSTHLARENFPHIGISFATDVMVTAARDVDELSRLRFLLPSLDLVVTDNYATENALLSLGAAADHILRIPWGPASSARGGSMTRAECGWPDDKKILLYPRSLEPHYDPDVFVDALAELVTRVDDVLAVFVEVGSLVSDIRERLASRGLSDYAYFEPLRNPEEFRSMMGCADAVVVTPRTDGTSVTVMDAMAQGVPVVSSLTAGSSEWVIDGITGWTFPVGNASALAAAIERALVVDVQHRNLMTSQAKRLVDEKAGWGSSSSRLSEVIHRLLPNH